MHSLHDKMLYWAQTQPGRPFVIEAETGRTLSYGQCAAAVAAMRRMLGNEQRAIALTLPGGIADAIIWLSVLTGGHRLVPLAPDAGTHERSRVRELFDPDVVIVEALDEAQKLASSTARVMTRDEIEGQTLADNHEADGRAIPAASPSIPGYVYLHTSGTTGEPKWVRLDAGRIAQTAHAIRASHRLSRADRGLSVLPFFHVNAPVVSLCATLMAGSSVVIARRFSRSRFWSWVETYDVTWASIVPTIATMLVTTERPDFLPGALRFMRSASAPLPLTVLQQFEAKFGIPLVETYGLTEAAGTVAANPVPPGTRKPGSVGLPVEGIALRICEQRTTEADGAESALRDVAPPQTGEICIAGPSVITAYVGGDGADAFQHGWFRTGDLGYCDGDGYLYLTGRVRDVIIRGGENIAPREVEEVLLCHPAVADVAVVGRPDPLYGEQVVAYVVPRQAWSDALTEDLRRYAAARLTRQKVPAVFVAVDGLPRNPTGKIDREALRRAQRALARAESQEIGAGGEVGMATTYSATA